MYASPAPPTPPHLREPSCVFGLLSQVLSVLSASVAPGCEEELLSHPILPHLLLYFFQLQALALTVVCRHCLWETLFLFVAFLRHLLLPIRPLSPVFHFVVFLLLFLGFAACTYTHAMGCVTARAAHDGMANSKKSGKLSREESVQTAAEKKPNAAEVDYVAQLVAGYTTDYPQKGAVTTYEDYRGFEISTTNHVSKNKADKLCKWSDQALEDRLNLNNDVFFNPQNPFSWPKEVITNHLTSPSFADRNTVQEMTRK
ncbi:conserved hypothetical protein [Leishmania infantum JPCM5]|uniref:Uncharacterized protein n=2 Tax=Leishmania infantum TaxID=5671 RepID=A4IC20_LEIIN|nr:conserved hypothetical protein [Leishmania infantum JPCM5]CAC9547247.1 hypothetical_protein_-_conserved [Leishmania infantum]CAM72395.1 conserved hypothetical protein [Leishmania infantum JPCM5]SUZ46313.1 hypothetical_protein_-_conserved [Leishmania infantum]|eukprot:XP_001469289.1 conserved hypothetical protein [Leishmania infantum JPCM5]